jgi:hypothetical protein
MKGSFQVGYVCGAGMLWTLIPHLLQRIAQVTSLIRGGV